MILQLLEMQGADASFRKIYARIQKSHGTPQDYFYSVLEKEIIYREENRVLRWVQQAKFPFKTIAEFDFSFQPSIKQELINEFLSCRFIEQGKNIVFLGQSGVGKTHLSIGLGLEAINRGQETRCLTLDTLIDQVEKSDATKIPKLLRNLLLPKLLILDDIDFYDTGKNASTFLFKLVKERYDKNLSTILTSNKKLNDWVGLFGDQRRASAAIDRFMGRATIVKITGESYRMKDKVKAARAAV